MQTPQWFRGWVVRSPRPPLPSLLGTLPLGSVLEVHSGEGGPQLCSSLQAGIASVLKPRPSPPRFPLPALSLTKHLAPLHPVFSVSSLYPPFPAPESAPPTLSLCHAGPHSGQPPRVTCGRGLGLWRPQLATFGGLSFPLCFLLSSAARASRFVLQKSTEDSRGQLGNKVAQADGTCAGTLSMGPRPKLQTS